MEMQSEQPNQVTPSTAHAGFKAAVHAREIMDDMPVTPVLRMAQQHADRAATLWALTERLCERAGSSGADDLDKRAPSIVVTEAQEQTAIVLQLIDEIG